MPQISRRTAVAAMAAASAIAALPVSTGHAAEPRQPPVAEVVATMDARPGNPAITPDGRKILSVHPLDHPKTKMVELGSDGGTRVYPSAEFAAGEDATLKAVIAIRIADDGTAWILDLGARKLHAWDTKAERLVRTIDIPSEVLRPASFLQDFALDQKRNRVIIADMTQVDLKSAPQPAFVVIDLGTGEARRIAESHPALMPETKGGLALNPITIDPAYDWVYFGALNGRTINRVPAAAFDGTASEVTAHIEAYGPKPFSDGITVDSAGNVYVTDIEHHAIGVTTPAGYKIVAELPKGQSWPDGFSFGPDGFVYATVNQLDRSAALNGGKDSGKPPFQLVRVKALAKGATGR
ncbi:SMP-30/gluconolactonase/LRE family protein [Bosea beijingensis]